VKSLSKYFDLHVYDPEPPTSQTERQTDGQADDMQSQDRALHYRASRGKNGALLWSTMYI